MSVASANPIQNWMDLTKTEAPPKTEDKNSPEATKQMFLQLLVTQIKSQNPMNPADATEFVGQLSQFTGVEQMLAMRQELESIHGILAGEKS